MTTLNKHLHKLTKGEKAIICAVMRGLGSYPDCHTGLLPFLKLENVVDALNTALVVSIRKRVFAKLINKLSPDGSRRPIGVTLTLSDKKVFKRFGPNPQLGVVIPGLLQFTTTAGVSFNIGKKDYVPHKVRIPAKVALIKLGVNSWRVFGHTDIDKAVIYLLDHCGV